MNPDIFWIPEAAPGRLAILPRHRATDFLEEEVEEYRDAGIDVLLSLLTPFEVSLLGLREEEPLCRAFGIRFLSLPVEDRQAPRSPDGVLAMVADLRAELQQGRGVAVHCRMGIGRSAMVAACLLMQQGLTADQAFAAIAAARGVPVPDTDEQADWVRALAPRLHPAGGVA